MIGVSLPFGWLSDDTDIGPILSLLKKHGVGSVELRTVQPGHDPQTVLHAAEALWDSGFQITVHGSVFMAETAVSDVFDPLAALMRNMRQDKLNVTIHPIAGDNAAMLVALSDYIIAQGFPVTIALENNRLLPDKSQGDCAALVLEAIEKADRPNVGICFDMGHHAYYIKKNCADMPEQLPGREFWKRVIHTHIHALNDMQTHFPLGAYELPLKEYIDSLSYQYFGVYNLELDFPRIALEYTPEDAIRQSLPVLQGTLHHCARLYDDVREHFDDWFAGALECWKAEENTFALIHSSSYLFNTAGCRWGMDIAFRNSRILAKTPARAAELLKDMQLMVLSHGHADHYETDTLKALSKNNTLFLVPDFLEERSLELGIPAEKLVVARPGQPITLFGVTFLPFVSYHFRPNGNGIQEYGYYVTAPDCPSLVFPVDVRDFSKKADIPPADYCFANVWLDDNSSEGWEEHVAPWAAYMLSFSDKNIFTTHLYEDGRPDNQMWRSEHAEAVRAEILRRSPETNVRIPAHGKNIILK